MIAALAQEVRSYHTHLKELKTTPRTQVRQLSNDELSERRQILSRCNLEYKRTCIERCRMGL